MTQKIDIGHGIEMSYGVAVQGGEPCAVIVWHDDPENGNRVGVWFDGPDLPANRRGWTVVSRDPLTLSPSIVCEECGLHGWIQNGRWVPT